MFLPSKQTDKTDVPLVSMLQIYAIFFETTRVLLRFLFYQLIDSLVKAAERKQDRATIHHDRERIHLYYTYRKPDSILYDFRPMYIAYTGAVLHFFSRKGLVKA